MASIETTTSSSRRSVLALAIALALAKVAGCGPIGRLEVSPTDDIAEEHMPAYASLWLTSEPPVAT